MCFEVQGVTKFFHCQVGKNQSKRARNNFEFESVFILSNGEGNPSKIECRLSMIKQDYWLICS